jgi:hypothetical protein
MVAAMKKFWKDHRSDEVDVDDDCDAMFIPCNPARADDDDNRICGGLFYIYEQLHYGTIAHECWHAANYHDYQICGYRGHYWEDFISNYSAEERMAYKIEELVNGVIRICRKSKVKIKDEKSIYESD